MSDIELKIGADPEFFVYKDGKPVSAHGLIAGDKKNPTPVKDGAIQVDGMALEFNINPASSKHEFSNNIVSVLGQLREIIPAEYEFSFTPVAEFGEQYIAEQPEEAKRLGCDPDFNAWTGAANPTPNPNGTFRTASGHIHLGWTENQDVNDPEHIEACQMMVKQLDMVLGMASVIWDPDNRRRELYGKAGAYRPKPYGVEYRTMSNVWVNVPWMRDWVWDAATTGFQQLMASKEWYTVPYCGPEGLQGVINDGVWKTAINFIEHNLYDPTGMMRGVYNDRINDEKRLAAIKKAEALKGVKNTPNPLDYSRSVAQAQTARKRKVKVVAPLPLDPNQIEPVVPANNIADVLVHDDIALEFARWDDARRVRAAQWAGQLAQAVEVAPRRKRPVVVN